MGSVRRSRLRSTRQPDTAARYSTSASAADLLSTPTQWEHSAGLRFDAQVSAVADGFRQRPSAVRTSVACPGCSALRARRRNHAVVQGDNVLDLAP